MRNAEAGANNIALAILWLVLGYGITFEPSFCFLLAALFVITAAINLGPMRRKRA